MAMIKIKNLTKAYGDKVVLDNLNLDIQKGSITVILGESGIGKTTLLNCISSLTEYQGQIDGVDKDISYVFQTDRLIANLTVEQNLRLICGDIDITSGLKNVGLNGVEKLYPKQLSAGMKRRIALVRAFLYPSSLVLMDEPFINLDLSKKNNLIAQVKRLKDQQNKTIVMVTHDVKEAVMLADRIIVLSKHGVVLDIDSVGEDSEERLVGALLNGDQTKTII